MNGLNLVTCGICGWVHMGVTLGHAFGESKRFVEWYEEQPPDRQAHYAKTSYPELMLKYMHCFSCNSFCTNMVEFQEGDCPDGVTIQPIVAHAELVFDEAESDELRISNHLLARAKDILRNIKDCKTMESSVLANWLRDYASNKQRRDA